VWSGCYCGRLRVERLLLWQTACGAAVTVSDWKQTDKDKRNVIKRDKNPNKEVLSG